MPSLPETLVLRPSRGKWSLVLLIGFSFAAVGVLMTIKEGFWSVGPFCAVFFGAVGVVAVLQLLGASELRLDRAGFRVRSLYRRSAYRWDEVGLFYPIRAGNRLVGFNLAGPRGESAMSNFNRTLSGAGAALPDTYGLSPEALAALMNDWRTRALDRADEERGQ